MPSAPVQEEAIAETFDDQAHDRCCKYKSNGLTASSQVLLDFISNRGLVSFLACLSVQEKRTGSARAGVGSAFGSQTGCRSVEVSGRSEGCRRYGAVRNPVKQFIRGL